MKKNYTINIPLVKLWFVILPLVLVVLAVGSIIGVIIVDRLIMPNLPGMSDRGVVEVPVITELDKSDARQKLYDIGLRLDVQSREYSDNIAPNMVITQQPIAGKRVKKGRHILVILSRGPEIDTVPSVFEMQERLAKTTLRKSGFSNVVVERKYDSKIEKDYICRMDPEPGMITSREIPVKITISKGAKPTHATAPSIIGNKLSEAKKKLEDEGLQVGEVSYKSGAGVMVGAIISQSVAPGVTVPLDSKVNLVVGSK